MSQRVLVIDHNGQVKKVVLDKERVTLGRDKKCDVLLDDSEVSRQHAAVINRFGVIYVENISPTGQILKAGQAVEVCELGKGESVQVGPFKVSWADQDVVSQAIESASMNAAPSDLESAPVQDSAPIESAPVPAQLGALDEAPSENNLDVEFQVESQPIVSSAVVANPDGGGDLAADLGASIDDAHTKTAVDAGGGTAGALEPVVDGGTAVHTNAGTKVGTSASLQALLKVLKGEEIGREIKLSSGTNWTVGRGSKNDIQINSSKLSRSHFRIIKIASSYRVEDLGSANGTRVNGVSVSDSPLSSFDTIQAGPVELQFLIVDARASVADRPELTSGGVNLGQMGQLGEAESAQKTMFAAPVPYTPAPNYSQPQQGAAPGGFEYSSPSQLGVGVGNDTEDPGGSLGPMTMSEKWAALPPARKALFATLAIVGLAGAYLMNQSPDSSLVVAENTVKPIVAPSNAARDPASDNAAAPGDVSADFAQLSDEKKAKLSNLYAEAERARKAREWQLAFDTARQILETVSKYKDTSEIMAEASNALNESKIGMLNAKPKDVADAEAQNREAIEKYIEAGQKALGEQRWEDAQEAFTKAINLDPGNAIVQQGLNMALQKDLKAAPIDVPNGQPSIPQEVDLALQSERDDVDGYRMKLRDAHNNMLNGRYGVALVTLKELDAELRVKLSDYQANRAPASAVDSLTSDLKKMQLKTRDNIDKAREQLRIEYRTQMADADEFITNRQYAQARDIYDRILRIEPGFDEAEDARDRLYSRIFDEAKSLYQEALIYESVGDLDQALDGYTKTKDLLNGVRSPLGTEYFKRATDRMKRIKK
jgi:pSer/pThr/pTyr-binding forkhead associated (FHA) protein/tetratricopeptide (TPR) repeat protein